MIGPYEVYTDILFGYKTAFEAFITVRKPEAGAALNKYKATLRDMSSGDEREIDSARVAEEIGG